jgi:hypothetical protein
MDKLKRIALIPAGPHDQVGKSAGDPVGEFLDTRPLGAVMTRQQQADAQRFRFQRAMEACFTGQQNIGFGPRGIGQEIISRSTRDGHVQNRLPGIADDLHGRLAQRPRDVRGELFESTGLEKTADPAGT